MAFLYIWEFSELLVRDGAQMPKTPGIIQQAPVAITNVQSNQSAAFKAGTAFIVITADEICSIAIGSNPVATTNSYRIPQGAERQYGVNPGDKIAVIANV